MDKITLIERDAFSDMGLPHSAGGVTLAADQPGFMVSVAPFAGQDAAVSAALTAIAGCALAAIGTSCQGAEFDLWWVGQGQWMATGAGDQSAQVIDALQGLAAAVDQSDGWVGMRISGTTAGDVMARLCPLDVEMMPVGAVARSQFAHMMAIIRALDGGYQVLVMRSFLRTATHHTITAMDSLAAQAAL